MVHILHVDALTVEDAHLVVDEVASAGILEEVTLQLHADVASVAGVCTSAVAESGKLRDHLRVAHESLVDRVHRILVGEGVLKLSSLHAQEVIFLPLDEEIDEFRAGSER